MRPSIIRLVVTAALLAPLPAAAQPSPEDADRATNIGITSCSSYIVASIGLPARTHLHTRLGNYQLYDYSLRVLDWMTGYIIYFKSHTKLPAAMVHSDYGSIDTFLRSYCTQSPQAYFQSAADAFIQQQLDNTI